jgi:tRNA threonylcarbamoyladenosine biosynthesis protein TsaB
LSAPIVLAVDTCSTVASFAIATGGKLLTSFEDHQQLPHSQTLFANLEQVLRQTNLSLSQVEVFAGNTGPGSFTGVRVGLASLKGLGQALNRTVIGVNTLDLMALASSIQGRFLVLLEAGRREVFAGLRMVDPSGLVRRIEDDLVGDLAVAIEQHRFELERGAILMGSGVAKYSEELRSLAEKMGRTLVSLPAGQFELIQQQAKQCWIVYPGIKPLAPTLALYAARLLVLGSKLELHAYYIRPSDAELHYPTQD